MSPRQMVPLFFFLLALIAMVITVVALYFRYRKLQLFHQERMAALEKGVPVPNGYTQAAPWSPRVYLLRGLVWGFVGLAFMISFLAIAHSTQRPASVETALWRAQNLSQRLGISAEEARRIVEKDPASQQEGVPWGMACLGLIPMGVGIAHLIFYYTGDTRQADFKK
jgi:hypothetical protein